MTIRHASVALLAVAVLQAQPPATLVIRNARIWTGDAANPWADSLAATDDILIKVGKVPANIPLKAGAEVIDAKGRLVTPGFIDSHVHLIEAGLRLNSVKLRDAKTRKEFTDRIAKFAASQPDGAWIIGGDWDHENWGGGAAHATVD